MGCGKCGRWVAKPDWVTTVLRYLPHDIVNYEDLGRGTEDTQLVPIRYCVCSTCRAWEELTRVVSIAQSTGEHGLLDSVAGHLRFAGARVQQDLVSRRKRQ